jgi:hypothetical protein
VTAHALGTVAVACTWAVAVFAALQLASTRHPRALATLMALLALGVALIGLRTGTFGYAWLRHERLRSDALALGALVPLVATTAALFGARATRTTWGMACGIASSTCCGVAGFAALVVGRSGWYWEFVAIIVAGAAFLAFGAMGATSRALGPNRRIVAGTAALFGCFLAVGGGLLLVAWNATL